MNLFAVIQQDRTAKSFHIFLNGSFIVSSKKSPGEIAQGLLESGIASGSDRFEVRNHHDRLMLDHTVASAASYSDKKTLQSLKHFSAHLPPEPINAGGDVFSPSSPATSFSNERGFLGS